LSAGTATALRVTDRARPRRLGRRLQLLGPAFVAAVAYVDPGNFATNLTGGSAYGYALVWVVVLASAMAMQVQYLSAKLGLATGQNLPEAIRDRCSTPVLYVLWAQAEVMAVATDLAEFVGAAVALNLLFDVPLFPAGLMTAALAFGILAFQHHGYRPFERAVVGLLGIVAAGLLYDLLTAGHLSASGVAHGMVPTVSGDPAMLTTAVAIVGATVMPHVVYLHSAMTQSRVPTQTTQHRMRALRWFRTDCILGLGAAGVINVAMLMLAAVLFHHPGHAGVTTLSGAYDGLRVSIGAIGALAFAVALLASGLSSASVGTYAGQVIMQGFLQRRIPLMLRRLLTMVPALCILAIGVSTTQALVISQVVLSFGVPFALIPLLLLTSNRRLMHEFVNKRRTTVAATLIVVTIVGLNALLLATTFGWTSS
jgi:manganese transport protein